MRAPEEAAPFPFSVPAVRTLPVMAFPTPITFFVGANGSGKSTLMEAIAAAAGLPAVGSGSMAHDETLAAARTLGKALHLTWNARTRRGFFLRAEDFFGYAKKLAADRAELQRELAELPARYKGRSTRALALASGPLSNSLAEMERRYGADLDANSHGQAFLTLFRSRFVPGGLHLLDEPEAPLSPHSQMALIAMLHDMAAQGAQFIVATHSPIVMAYPGATIYDFDATPVAAVRYEETEHYTITRAFLNNHERYIRQLLTDTTSDPELP
ncbi:MAG: AAA family ATPase [Gemmatimonadota bacterium]|nr:AAA family ATPase [Gemmatimonadota bacterium]